MEYNIIPNFTQNRFLYAIINLNKLNNNNNNTLSYPRTGGMMDKLSPPISGEFFFLLFCGEIINRIEINIFIKKKYI